MRSHLEKYISETLGIPQEEVNVSLTTDFKNGDYSTNIALVLAKKEEVDALLLAERFVEKFQARMPEGFRKIEFISPGFINFFLDEEVLRGNLKKILAEGKEYGKVPTLSGKKIFIEHTQPNPFKDFHIGHLMNNAIGESITRILRASGAEVMVATYHGDKGLHVAKALWGLRKSNVPVTISSMSLAYAEGNKAYEENEEAKREIQQINKEVYEGNNTNINTLYEEGRRVSFSFFESLYHRLGSDFDVHFYESESGEVGKELVLEFLSKGVFEQSEGAIVFRGENVGLHTRVFINSEGLPTYETKELGLAKMKRDLFPYDLSLSVVANEQDDFFKVVEVVVGKVFPELSGKLRHLSHGLLKLPSGKMSSRTGSIIPAETLLQEIEERVLQRIADRDIPENEKRKIAEKVAIGAIRFSILKQGIGRDIIFDFEKSLSFEGDSGPYLQYTGARIHSLLGKAEEVALTSSFGENSTLSGTLERILVRFPEIVRNASEEYAPQKLVSYLLLLASEFNSYYAQNRILDADDAPYRVALSSAVCTTLTNGLFLLGIEVPERM